MLIDTSFDVRTDAGGKDPDCANATLRRYHHLLWSKALPSGKLFDLSEEVPSTYLHHKSELGEFNLASDSVVPTFTRWKRKSMRAIVDQFPEAENEAFRTIGYTIGAIMVFPGNKIDGRQTLNGARGFTRAISDRFDLTIECIRRHYLGEESPLGDALTRYQDFFDLFEDFDGYVDFFLLDDLVAYDGRVRFFMPFDDFNPPAVPTDVEIYTEYRRLSIEFINARNRRIDALRL